MNEPIAESVLGRLTKPPHRNHNRLGVPTGKPDDPEGNKRDSLITSVLYNMCPCKIMRQDDRGIGRVRFDVMVFAGSVG